MSIKVTVVADICPTIGGNDVVEKQILAGKSKDLIKPVLPLFEKSDIIIGNLEAAVYDGDNPIDKWGPPLAMKHETLKKLAKDMGFSGFTLANNHIYDHGYEGLKSTVEILQKENIPHCGAGLTHDYACKPMVFNVKGKSIAVFNFAEGEFAQSQYNDAGAARIDTFFSHKMVMDAKTENDYVIVILHLGNEHFSIPGPHTLNNCRAMAEAGADAVIGHHAHIPQFMEYHKDVPVCYSLGNFMFGAEFSKERHASWYLATVADITLDDDGAKLEIVPYRQLEDLALHELGKEGGKILDQYFSKCKEICDNPETYRKIWAQEIRNTFGNDIEKGFVEFFGQFASYSKEEAGKTAKLFYNLFTGCSSHCKRFGDASRLLYDGKGGKDEEADAVLKNLTEMLEKVLYE